MSSRERRMLHLALKAFDDIETASSGEGLGRYVVAYPKGSRLPGRAAEASLAQLWIPRVGSGLWRSSLWSRIFRTACPRAASRLKA